MPEWVDPQTGEILPDAPEEVRRARARQSFMRAGEVDRGSVAPLPGLTPPPAESRKDREARHQRGDTSEYDPQYRSEAGPPIMFSIGGGKAEFSFRYPDPILRGELRQRGYAPVEVDNWSDNPAARPTYHIEWRLTVTRLEGMANRELESHLRRELEWIASLGEPVAMDRRVRKQLTAQGWPELIDPELPVDLPIPEAFTGLDFSWGLRQLVGQATREIERALARVQRPYIAYSGGKDSTVLVHLVHAVDPTVPVIWSDDELEYPQTVQHMEALKARLGDQFIALRGHSPHASWFRSWSDQPYWREPLPGTVEIAGMMADWATQQGYGLTFLGLRGEESKARANHLEEVGATYRRRGGLVCAPLHRWGDEHIWQFIWLTGAEYNFAYRIMRGIGLPPELQRVGPLPLVPRETLALGWPSLLRRLEARYGSRWA